jgi:hypothetical protein
LQRQLINLKFRPSLPQSEAPKAKLDRKASCKRKGSGKVVADKKEVKAVIEKGAVKEPVKEKQVGFRRKGSRGDLQRKRLLLSIKNCELN